MALFVATHNWKQEEFKTVTKKVIEALQQIPEGATLYQTYVKANMDGAWCIWQAESADLVKNFITEKVPEMETEVTPAVQFFPPNPELYGIIHRIIS